MVGEPKEKENDRNREKRQRKDTYYLGECVHVSHKLLCFIRMWPKVQHGGVLWSLISLGQKYRGRFCKNRRRSGFQWAFLKLSARVVRGRKRGLWGREAYVLAGKSKRKGRQVWDPDGSANLFYADLASPFDSLGYHCRRKSFFSISQAQTTKLFVHADFVSGENVTLKSTVTHRVEYEEQQDFAITLYFNGRGSF